MGNIRALDLLKLAAAVAASIVVVAGFACISRSLNDSPEEQAYGYFLRDVATVEAMGLPVYWLGREFTVDGLGFRGPYGGGFGGEVEGGGIYMTYLLEGANSSLDLTVYSREAWELVKDRMMNPRLPGIERRTVSVAGRDGELLFQYAGAGPRLNALWLVLDLGDVVAVAEAHSVIGSAVQGSPELNPLIKNPDLLVQVMQDLRPYPQ